MIATPVSVTVTGPTVISTTNLLVVAGYAAISFGVEAIPPPDLAYFLEPLKISGLESTIPQAVGVELSCSLEPAFILTYDMFFYQTTNVPSWVTLNTTTSKLHITPPEITQTTVYKIQIVVKDYNGVLGTKIVELEIVPKKCKVANCNECTFATNNI